MPFSCCAFFLYAGYGTINKKVNVMIFAALRNGVKSTLRARKRSVLFMVLMILLTLVLTVGAGFYITADQLVKEANDIFISSVKIEYLGESYPSRTVYDSYVRKAAEELMSPRGKTSRVSDPGIRPTIPCVTAMISSVRTANVPSRIPGYFWLRN